MVHSLLDTFRSHNIALEGISTQLDALSKDIKQSNEFNSFKSALDEMNRSTVLIYEELMKVVKNLQSQYRFD